MPHSLSRKQLIMLGIATTLISTMIALFAILTAPLQQDPTEAPASVISPIAPARPDPRPEDMISAQEGHSFAVFVSYKDKGFEPTEVVIRIGETVRFTNNSTHDLWLAARGASGSKIYPGRSDCGASALDSCKPLKPGDYWQFTFTESGSWFLQNNVDTAATATVMVSAL